MKEVELVGNFGEYNFDLVKIALKKKCIIIDESMVDFIPSTNPPTVPDLKKHLSGSNTNSTVPGQKKRPREPDALDA